MPRKPRFYAPGIAYHVSQFVRELNPCFYNDRDYNQCLDFLLDASLDYDCDIHAFALLPDGLHLILVPGEEQSIPRFMQSLARRYVAYFNHEYHRTGSLWTQRYKASAIDDGKYIIMVSQYIESRPVQLGYAETQQAYDWSSYQSNTLGISNGLTSYHKAYLLLGADQVKRQKNYARLAETQQDLTIHQSIEQSLALGLPLGSSQFKQELAQTLNVLPIALYPRRSLASMRHFIS